MIKLENKTITVKVNTNLGVTPVPKKYSDLIIEVINLPPKEGGFTVTEMKSRIGLIDKMEQANGVIELTPEDLLKIKDCVSRMSWRFISKEIIQFTEAIDNLK